MVSLDSRCRVIIKIFRAILMTKSLQVAQTNFFFFYQLHTCDELVLKQYQIYDLPAATQNLRKTQFFYRSFHFSRYNFCIYKFILIISYFLQLINRSKHNTGTHTFPLILIFKLIQKLLALKKILNVLFPVEYFTSICSR